MERPARLERLMPISGEPQIAAEKQRKRNAET
jgi:hypothetical protein